MRQWTCKCGNLQCFGSDSPRTCTVCSKCGSTALKNFSGDYIESTFHEWRIIYDTYTGNPKKLQCKICYISKPIENEDKIPNTIDNTN